MKSPGSVLTVRGTLMSLWTERGLEGVVVDAMGAVASSVEPSSERGRGLAHVLVGFRVRVCLLPVVLETCATVESRKEGMARCGGGLVYLPLVVACSECLHLTRKYRPTKLPGCPSTSLPAYTMVKYQPTNLPILSICLMYPPTYHHSMRVPAYQHANQPPAYLPTYPFEVARQTSSRWC